MLDGFSTYLWIGGAAGLALGIWGSVSGLRRDHPTDYFGMKKLVELGVNLELPMNVQFWLWVRTPASAEHLRRELESDGFSVRLEVAKESPEVPVTEAGILILGRKEVVLYGSTLRDFRAKFTALAKKENGDYVGWQAF